MNESKLSSTSFASDLKAQCHFSLDEISTFSHTLHPFLVTCAIEFSVICAAAQFVLWLNIGYKNEPSQTKSLHSRKRHLRVDCTSSTTGVFGIFCNVFCILTLIRVFGISGDPTGNLNPKISQAKQNLCIPVNAIFALIVYIIHHRQRGYVIHFLILSWVFLTQNKPSRRKSLHSR